MIVNKYINTYQGAIKMKPVDVKSSTYIDFNKNKKKEGPKFKLAMIQDYQNMKNFLQKAIFQIGSKVVFVIKKVKHNVPWTYVISEIIGTFYKKELQKQIRKSSELKK